MENKKCIVWWCGEKHYAHGYCMKHYTAVARYGSPYGKQANVHFQQYKRIEEMTLQARKVSKAVVDSMGILGPECPFCHGIEAHEPDCPTFDAQLILEHTR